MVLPMSNPGATLGSVHELYFFLEITRFFWYPKKCSGGWSPPITAYKLMTPATGFLQAVVQEFLFSRNIISERIVPWPLVWQKF